MDRAQNRMKRLGGEAMEFSPPTAKVFFPASDEKEKEIETIFLKSFAATPCLDFGEVVLGNFTSQTLLVVNEEDFPQTILVEKFEKVAKSGFSFSDPSVFAGIKVPAKSRLSLRIDWRPSQPGAFRQLLSFHVDMAYRISAKLIGTCKPTAESKPKRRSVLNRSRRTQKKSMRMEEDVENVANRTVILEEESDETAISNSTGRAFQTPAVKTVAHAAVNSATVTKATHGSIFRHNQDLQREFDALSSADRRRFDEMPSDSISSPRRQTVTVAKRQVLQAIESNAPNSLNYKDANSAGNTIVHPIVYPIVRPIVRDDQERVEVMASSDAEKLWSNETRCLGPVGQETAPEKDIITSTPQPSPDLVSRSQLPDSDSEFWSDAVEEVSRRLTYAALPREKTSVGRSGATLAPTSADVPLSSEKTKNGVDALGIDAIDDNSPAEAAAVPFKNLTANDVPRSQPLRPPPRFCLESGSASDLPIDCENTESLFVTAVESFGIDADAVFNDVSPTEAAAPAVPSQNSTANDVVPCFRAPRPPLRFCIDTGSASDPPVDCNATVKIPLHEDTFDTSTIDWSEKGMFTSTPAVLDADKPDHHVPPVAFEGFESRSPGDMRRMRRSMAKVDLKSVPVIRRSRATSDLSLGRSAAEEKEVVAESTLASTNESVLLDDTINFLKPSMPKRSVSQRFKERQLANQRKGDSKNSRQVRKSSEVESNDASKVSSVAKEESKINPCDESEVDLSTDATIASKNNSCESSTLGDSTIGHSKSSRMSHRTTFNATFSRPHKSKLILMKASPQTSSSGAKVALPFASSGGHAYFDVKWQEKQEFAFTQMLNHVFACSLLEVKDEVADAPVKPSALKAALREVLCGGSAVRVAPTREEQSIRVYTQRHELFRLRGKSCRLWEALATAVGKIEEEVGLKRIMMRRDRNVHADLGAKTRILNLLLSYNPLWLRIGIETVFGEILLVSSNSDIIGMSKFIVARLLNDPVIAKRFSHPTVPHLYLDGYSDALAGHILCAFLKIVVFLDFAKSNRLIPQNPCLFLVTSEYKSTKALLLEFSKQFLSEGDLTKHLKYMGYAVKVEQRKIEEYEFGVRNLAVDLRDGIRLCKLVSTHFADGHVDLMDQVRLQDSRLNKIHNVKLALKRLEARGVVQVFDDKTARDPKAFAPADVVDGNRERTLKLLWRIFLGDESAGVLGMLNARALSEEIRHLEANLRIQRALKRVGDWKAIVGDPGALDDIFSKATLKEGMKDYGVIDDKIRLLLRWTQLVSAHYSPVPVFNFSVPFSDGRVFCYLLHHYRPEMVSLSEVRSETTQTYQSHRLSDHMPGLESSGEPKSPVDSLSTVLGEDGVPLDYQQRLDNEKANVKLVMNNVDTLGGVPMMLRAKDFCNTQPNEEVVIAFTAHLCSRLLDLAKEERAARVIQMAWRRRFLKQKIEEQRVKVDAGKIIGRCVLRWWAVMKAREEAKKRRAAIVVANTVFRYFKLAQWRKKRSAVLRIQAWYRDVRAKRNLVERENFLRQRRVAIAIQTWFRSVKRMKADRDMYLRRKWAAETLQRRWRALVVMRKERALFETSRAAVITVQKFYRSLLLTRRLRAEFIRLKSSVICLQQSFRAQRAMECQRVSYLATKNAAILIQIRFRAYLLMKSQRNAFLQKKRACLIIEARYLALREMRLARWKYLEIKKAASVIQLAYRNFRLATSQRRKYTKLKNAAILIQRWWRATDMRNKERADFLATRHTVCLLQYRFRANKLGRDKRIEYLRLRESVVSMQRIYRENVVANKCREEFLRKKSAARVIQAFWRSYRTMTESRKEFLKIRDATIKIQMWYKNKKAALLYKQQFFNLRMAAFMIQRRWRATLQRNKERARFLAMKEAVICIQGRFRAMRLSKEQRNNFLLMKDSALKIERYYSAWVISKQIRLEYMKKREAALVIQYFWHSYRTMTESRKEFLKIRDATIKIKMWYKNMKAALLHKQQFSNLRMAALLIQRRWRATLQRNKERARFLAMKEAAIFIQGRFRAMRLAKKERDNFLLMKDSALKIERFYSAWVVSRQIRREYMKKREAALLIKSFWRSCQLTLSCKRSFAAKKAAVVTLQRRWRASIEMREARKDFFRKKFATIVIENFYFNYKLMERDRNAFLIQKDAAICLQRHVRANFARKVARTEFLRQKFAAIVLQKNWRAFLRRLWFIAQKNAAVVIQQKIRATWKMLVERQKFLRLKEAALVIQTRFRSLQAMKDQRARFVEKRDAVFLLQSRWRETIKMWIIRDEYLLKKEAAMVIQRRFKAYLLMIERKRRFKAMKNAAVAIQSWYRMRLLVRGLINAATAAGAAKDERRRKEVAAKTIQYRWRATRKAALVRENFLAIRYAVVLIQRWWRSVSRKRDNLFGCTTFSLGETLGDISVVSAGFRDNSRISSAASESAEDEMLNSFSSISEVDSEEEEEERGAIGGEQAPELENDEEKRRKALIFIQSWWRGTRVRQGKPTIVSNVAEAAEEDRAVGAVGEAAAAAGVDAATRIHPDVFKENQFVPGRIADLRIRPPSDNAELHERLSLIRQRLETANKQAKNENRLGNITMQSLEEIIRGASIPAIRYALIRLTRTTSLSPECCEHLATQGAPGIIWSLMERCNQSEPCNEVRRCCVDVLLNLAKHAGSAPAVVCAHFVWDNLINLIWTYRHKDLFTGFCNLLAALVQHQNLALSFKSRQDLVQRLHKIHSEVARRVNLKQQHLAQKQRLQHHKSFSTNQASCFSYSNRRALIRPEFLSDKKHDQALKEPVQMVAFILELLDSVANPSVDEASKRRPLPPQQQQQQQLQRNSAGGSGCRLQGKAKVTKTRKSVK